MWYGYHVGATGESYKLSLQVSSSPAHSGPEDNCLTQLKYAQSEIVCVCVFCVCGKYHYIYIYIYAPWVTVAELLSGIVLLSHYWWFWL